MISLNENHQILGDVHVEKKFQYQLLYIQSKGSKNCRIMECLSNNEEKLRKKMIQRLKKHSYIITVKCLEVEKKKAKRRLN